MWKMIVLLLFAVSPANAQNYTISTVAGGGAIVTSQSATSYGLGQPSGIAVDLAGNRYIALPYLCQVWMVNSSGLLTQVIGIGACGFAGDGGAAASAQLNNPWGVAVDSFGNLYIADTYNNRIRKVSGGIITTVAGNGYAGFSGDGGVASRAELNNPRGAALDSSGNLYIADTYNSRIRMVSGGIITTIAGNGIYSFSGDGGSATAAGMTYAGGVAVDSSENLYIADTENSRIRKVSGGIITTVAGNGYDGFSGDGGSATSAGLYAPNGVAVDGFGNLYIADSVNFRIRLVSGGVISTVAGDGNEGYTGDNLLATSTELSLTYGVAVDSVGNVYIADTHNNRIRKIAGGIITTVVGNGLSETGDGGVATSAQLDQPQYAVADSSGNLFISDLNSCVVRKVAFGSGVISTVAGNSICGYNGDGGSAAAAELSYPEGIALDSSGTLYIADTDNCRIRKVSGGTITTVAGSGNWNCGYAGDGGAATSAQLNFPETVALDSSGNLYIADTGNGRIRKVSAGIITTVAGNGGMGFTGDGGDATLASLWVPFGVAVDNSGNLYIADTENYRIRKVSGGMITTVAGNGGSGFGGDGGEAISALLSFSESIAVDSSENLYIADTYNHRIRKVSGGIITTVAGDGTPGYNGDDLVASSAELNYPQGVAVDSSGRVYIADGGNNRVRELTAGVLAPPSAVSVTPASGSGASQTFSFVFYDPAGASDIVSATSLIGATLNLPPMCKVLIDLVHSSIYLLTDAGSTLAGPIMLGETGTIQNSQCAVNGATSSAAASGNTLTVNVGLTFTAGFSGTKSVFASAASVGGRSSGWAPLGYWNVPIVVEAPWAVSVTPASGSSLSQTFAFAFTDSSGYQDMAWQQIIINSGLTAAGGCYIYYSPSSNQIYLGNNSGSGTLGPQTLGTSGMLQNSQCSLNVGSSTATGSGNNLTLNLALTFESGFTGVKTIWADTSSNAALSLGWQSLGTWTPVSATPPSATSVSPRSGTGISQTFSFVFADPLGYPDMVWQQIIINSGLTAAGGCYIYYSPSNNQIYLGNNSGSGTLGPQTLGTSGTLQNSQCLLNVGSSTATGSGNNLTLNLALTFESGFTGAKNIWADTASSGGLSMGWQSLGTWTPGTAGPPSATSVSPSSGTGLSQTFSFVFADPLGYQDMVWQQIIINSGLTATGGCYIYYSPSSKQIYVGNNSGSGTLGPLTVGTSGTLQNSQCVLNVGSSTATGSGNNLTLNLALTFESGFTGAKTIWADTASNAGLSMGWQTLGTWTPASATPPSATSVSPSSGSGVSQTFSFVFADPLGYQDMAWQQIIINSGLTAAGGCYIYYSPSSNQLYLGNNAGSGTLGPVTVGTSGTLQNSQCSLNVGSSTATGSGNNLTLNLALTFESGFTGAKTIWADTASNAGLSMGWQTLGTWTPGAAGPAATSVSPSSGSGISQTFSFVFTDSSGYQDMAWQQIIINSGLTAAGGCYIYYSPSSKQIYLGNNAGSGTLGPLTLGTSGTLQNSQCSLNVGSSSVVDSGNTLTLNLALTFESGFTGAQNIWADTASNAGLSMGWQSLGSWTP